jgi:hypothetical protein
MRLLPISIVLTLLILSGCNLWSPAKEPKWTNATAAENFERLMWKAIQDKDWPLVERHLAPVFVGAGPRGETLDHASWIEYWKKAQLQDFSIGEFSSQPDGPDMVATYILHSTGTETGQVVPAKGLRIVSVWQELKGGWVLTSQSATPIL